MMRAEALCLVAAVLLVGRAVAFRHSGSHHDGAHKLPVSLRAKLQAILDDVSKRYNTSYSFGFTDASGSISVAAGVDDVWAGTLLSNETAIPLGSVTKPFTAIQVMQAVEAGRISLNDKAYVWVDDLLMNASKRTLSDLFGESSKKVTIKDLLGMTSGLEDYDDDEMKQRTKRSSRSDQTPFDYFNSVSGTTSGPTKGRALYSGINYILLGFVLLKLQGKTDWEDLDQMAVIPKHLRSRYTSTRFASSRGPCSSHGGVAHQYLSEFHNGIQFIHDLWYNSCLNGWTMGNIITTPKDLSTFYYDVFTNAGFVNKTTLQTMLKSTPLDNDWCFGQEGAGSCKYGLGFNSEQVMDDLWWLKDFHRSPKDVELLGHLGANWGSGASPCGFNKKYSFGICLAYTSSHTLRCDLDTENDGHGQAHGEAMCKVYDAVLAAVGGPRLDCTKWSLPPKEPHRCAWRRAPCVKQEDVADMEMESSSYMAYCAGGRLPRKKRFPRKAWKTASASPLEKGARAKRRRRRRRARKAKLSLEKETGTAPVPALVSQVAKLKDQLGQGSSPNKSAALRLVDRAEKLVDGNFLANITSTSVAGDRDAKEGMNETTTGKAVVNATNKLKAVVNSVANITGNLSPRHLEQGIVATIP